jgi:nucleoside-diphosphate-sugar epimerase
MVRLECCNAAQAQARVIAMRILVTGGTGFVGHSLCPALAAAGHEVAILTRQANARLPQGARSAATRL